MDDLFRNFIDMVDTADDEQAIRGAIKNFAFAAGFKRFAYLQTEGPKIERSIPIHMARYLFSATLLPNRRCVREACSEEPDVEYAMVDAIIVEVHRHGQGSKRETQSQAIGRSEG